jgi:hypothetical protein
MARIKIYDSEGNEVKPDGSRGGSSNRVKQFFYAGVRLAITFNRSPEAVVFFRARTGSGRAEQYYAVYEADSRRNLLSELEGKVRTEIENSYGMTVVESTDDTELFRRLSNLSKKLPGSDFERDLVARLAGEGRNPRIGVGSIDEALTLISSLSTDNNTRSFAVADQAQHNALTDYGVAIEVGAYRGIEPLGSTEQDMNRGRKEMKDQFISQKMGNIKDEIRDIRQQTDVSNQQLRQRLKRELSVLETESGGPGHGAGGTPGGYSGGSGAGTPLGGDDSRLPGPLDGQTMMLAGGVVVVVLLLVVGAVSTGLFGLPCAVPVGNDNVCPPPSIQQQPDAEKIYVTGSLDGNVTEVTVGVWLASTENQTADTRLLQTKATVSNSSYNATLDLSEHKVKDGEKYVVAVSDQNNNLLHQTEFTAEGWSDKKNNTSSSTPTATPSSSSTATPPTETSPKPNGKSEQNASIKSTIVTSSDGNPLGGFEELDTKGTTTTMTVEVSVDLQKMGDSTKTNVTVKLNTRKPSPLTKTKTAATAQDGTLTYEWKSLKNDVSGITLAVNGTKVDSRTEATAWIDSTAVIDNGNQVGTIEKGTATKGKTLNVTVQVDSSKASSPKKATVTLNGGNNSTTKTIGEGKHTFTFENLSYNVTKVELKKIDSDTLEAPGGSSALTDVAPHERTRTVARVAG